MGKKNIKRDNFAMIKSSLLEIEVQPAVSIQSALGMKQVIVATIIRQIHEHTVRGQSVLHNSTPAFGRVSVCCSRAQGRFPV